jgi:23S rRNA pseudouridine1911/1915/1917 synthase
MNLPLEADDSGSSMKAVPDISVLYEDQDLVAVFKPAGLMIHPDGKSVEPTLTDWLVANYKEAREVGGVIKLASGGEVPRAGILHRIDRETSGVVVLARSQNAFDFFQKQFIDRLVKKQYYAFVFGEVAEPAGTISLPIGRSRDDFRKRAVGKRARGLARPAETVFRRVMSARGFSFLELEPTTGRTHQLRVHLEAIDHPIVCDSRYGPKRPCALGFRRLALHAASLSISLLSGRKVLIKAPFPPDFQRAIELLAVRPE